MLHLRNEFRCSHMCRLFGIIANPQPSAYSIDLPKIIFSSLQLSYFLIAEIHSQESPRILVIPFQLHRADNLFQETSPRTLDPPHQTFFLPTHSLIHQHYSAVSVGRMTRPARISRYIHHVHAFSESKNSHSTPRILSNMIKMKKG